MLVVLRYICERYIAAIHGEDSRNKKQADQFEPRITSPEQGSRIVHFRPPLRTSLETNDPQFRIRTQHSSLRNSLDLHNESTITLLVLMSLELHGYLMEWAWSQLSNATKWLHRRPIVMRGWGPCLVRGPVDGRFLVWWVIDNVVWTNSWLSIAGAGCGLAGVGAGAGEEQARKVVAGKASRCGEDK
jgi:hypothetical protein